MPSLLAIEEYVTSHNDITQYYFTIERQTSWKILQVLFFRRPEKDGKVWHSFSAEVAELGVAGRVCVCW